MSTNNTWVKLYRSLLDWEWYGDINTCRLFLHTLLKANYKDKKWRGETVERGSLITSLENLSTETGLSIQQIRTSIAKLKSTHDITYQGTRNYSRITINNYDKYQTSTHESTDNQQTINTPITTTKEIYKERNNIYICSFEKFWELYPRKVAKRKAEGMYKRVATSKEREDRIMEGLERYTTKWKKEGSDLQFIPHPTTWLNQGRWEDEIEVENPRARERFEKERAYQATRELLKRKRK